MKVTAFIGSARKQYTYNASEQFLQKLQSLGNIEYEIVRLNDYNLKTCKGCRVCLDKGEELCPLKDDRDILFEKIYNSDGIVFATPNYSFHVSGIMKIFLDRLGFFFHRPRFFGKTCTSIVAQGIYGANDIIKYFSFIGKNLGFNVVKGFSIVTVEPMTDERRKEIDGIIDKQSKIFYSKLIKKEYPVPSFFDIMVFRMARSSMNVMLNESSLDYNYYRDNGWFESDYFYPVNLNPIKKLSGKFFDSRVAHVARTKNKVGFY